MEHGPVDGTSEWSQRDRTLQVFLENELVQEIPLSFESMVQTITIPLHSAHAFRLEIKAIGAGSPKYGFANLQLS